jgi:hypothetical protein
MPIAALSRLGLIHLTEAGGKTNLLFVVLTGEALPASLLRRRFKITQTVDCGGAEEQSITTV